jgi:hypothetical protein
MPHTDEVRRHEEHTNSQRLKERERRESRTVLAVEIAGILIVIAILIKGWPS